METRRPTVQCTTYLEVETTTLGALNEEGTSAGFVLEGATCFNFEELVLLTSPLVTMGWGSVGFLGRRRGILNLACFFSYSSAKSAIVCVGLGSTFVSHFW